MPETQESEQNAARLRLLEDNLAEAVRLAEAFFAGQAEAQAAAEQALKEKGEIELRIQTLIDEKTAAEETAADLEAPFIAQRDTLITQIRDLEVNLAEAQTLLEIQQREKIESQAETELALAEKAELEDLKQAYWDEKIIAQNELAALEARMASESAALRNRVQDLEMKLSAAGSLAEKIEIERRAAAEKIETITRDKIASEKKFEDAFAGKITAEKELSASIKVNEALNLQLADYQDRLQQPKSKTAMVIILVLALVLLGYTVFLFRGYPNRITGGDGRLETAVSRFEDKTQLLNTLDQGQKQTLTRLDEIYKEVDTIRKKPPVDLSKGGDGWQDQVSALGRKVADLERQRNPVEIGEAKPPAPDSRQFQMLTEVYFESGETQISEKNAGSIRAAAERIKQRTGAPIRVEGHTDDKPLRWTAFEKFSNNAELALDRGATVARLLIKAGVDAKQISIIGIGPVHPAAANDSPEGRAKNRRVEIKMMDPPASLD